mmetsp:Transcript_20096/g.51623  ORF Transcript_20096/g.51623 Transcript_20096/m.51623 type:complete len:89 (+) Transcript_20096:1173-1439(+)
MAESWMGCAPAVGTTHTLSDYRAFGIQGVARTCVFVAPGLNLLPVCTASAFGAGHRTVAESLAAVAPLHLCHKIYCDVHFCLFDRPSD